MERPSTAISRYSNVTVNTIASSNNGRKRPEVLEDIFEIDGKYNDVTLQTDTIKWKPVRAEIPGQEAESDQYSISISENVIGLRLRKIKTMIKNNESRYDFQEIMKFAEFFHKLKTNYLKLLIFYIILKNICQKIQNI